MIDDYGYWQCSYCHRYQKESYHDPDDAYAGMSRPPSKRCPNCATSMSWNPLHDRIQWDLIQSGLCRFGRGGPKEHINYAIYGRVAYGD